jgi:adenylate kinase
MYLILLGAPGAGKGTVAKMLLKQHPAAHISTGDILRGNVAAGTKLGLQAKKFMDEGGLVPDSLILDMMKGRLAEADAQQGFILDGFPRTIPQAEGLGKILVELGIKLTGVISIDVPEQVILDRILSRPHLLESEMPGDLQCQVHAAQVEGVCDKCGGKLSRARRRDRRSRAPSLKVYEDNTAPLIQYYEAKGQLHRFPGESSDAIVDGVNAMLKK